MSDRNSDNKEWAVLYRKAFAEFGTRALWSMQQLPHPTPRDAIVVARLLRIEGDLRARHLAERLEDRARADL
jgi:hypothetical protein